MSIKLAEEKACILPSLQLVHHAPSFHLGEYGGKKAVGGSESYLFIIRIKA